MKFNILYLWLIVFALIGCSSGSNDDVSHEASEENPKVGQNGTWLIPKDEVFDGGPGKDGIPSIDSPKFVSVNDAEAEYLIDSELVVGYVNGNVARAYPHRILDWHESINDEVNGVYINISYCPLTGTAFGWKNEIEGSKTSFGVSGLLYNSNLILYDRKTDSNWSQLKLKCVNGERIGDVPKLVQVIETTWGEWKKLYPFTQVMNRDTGFERDYSTYPYGSYRTNGQINFPVSPVNNLLPSKERVFSIIDGTISKVYQFEKFKNGKTIIDEFNGRKYLIVGNENVIVGYQLEGELKDLTFNYDLKITNNVTLFNDNEGNKWSISGVALSGPRAGQKMIVATSVVSYWFAIAAFYPNPMIY